MLHQRRGPHPAFQTEIELVREAWGSLAAALYPIVYNPITAKIAQFPRGAEIAALPLAR